MSKVGKVNKLEYLVGFLAKIGGEPRSKNPYHWIRCNTKNNSKKIYWDNGWDKADIELAK